MSKKFCAWFVMGAVLSVFPIMAVAQGGILADYQNAENFLPGNLQQHMYIADVRPNWIGKTDRFWYLKIGLGGNQFIIVDAEHNTQGPAFDQARLAAALSKASGKNYSATNLPFYDFTFEKGGGEIQFEIGDERWSCALTTYACKQTATSQFESLSPNGEWAAFVKDYNLYVRNVPTGVVSQLTHDGKPGDGYATPLPDLLTLVHEGVTNGDNVQEKPAVFWSPDSTRLVTYQIDSRKAGRYNALQYVPPDQLRPIDYSYVYPLPGEILPAAMPVIFELTPVFERVDVKTPPLQIQSWGGPHFSWMPDSRHVYYTYDGRGEKYIALREVDADTGEQRTLQREDSAPYPYVDPGETMSRFVDHDKEFLWTSERSGWNQLYLYDTATGKLIRQLTHGNWVVRDIAGVNESDHEVYFLAGGVRAGVDPYYTYLYSVKLDGGSIRLLTSEDANHTVSVSPDGKYFVDNYSTPDMPAESVLRRTGDAAAVRVLERTDDSWLVQMGWEPPIPFKGTAADGKTELYGLIVKPTHFDSSRKYPVLEQIYTGPQGFFVPKAFGRIMGLQSMAELGFVVVMVDGRGTTGRSRDFHDFSYHNMGNVFIDHVDMIKQMAAKYPWMDINSVGIYGTSAGGYGSAHAFLQFPDFYKVCVSTSGDHDPRLDKAWWNELYQGYPVGKDYLEQANQTLASRLKGHLLLIHGDIDDNVNPTETMHLVDALMTANKPFDMLFVPNMHHGDSGPHAHYVTLRRWDYFVQYLLGVKPPNNFKIQEAPVHSFGRG